MQILSLDRLSEKFPPLFNLHEALSDPNDLRPGFIGNLPYLAALKILIYFGAFLRFFFHKDEYIGTTQVLLGIIFAIWGVVIFLDLKRQSFQNEDYQIWKWRIICLDILFISIFYYMTRKLESDFFLFYYLPIVASAEYLGDKQLKNVGILVTIAFATTLGLMVLSYGSPQPTFQVLCSHFLPREIFFILIVIISSHLRLSDIYRSRYSNQLKKILHVRAAGYDLQEVKEILDVSLKTAMEGTKSESGLIWLGSAGKQNDISAIVPKPINEDSIENIFARLHPLDSGTFTFVRGEKSDVNRQVLSIPLKTHNAIVGFLSVDTKLGSRDEDDKLNFLEAIAEPIGSVLEKHKLQTALNEIVRISSCAALLNHELDTLLNTLTRDKGCDYAAISLVDEYMGHVAMIRARNMAPRLIEMSRVNISSNNILASIVRNGKCEFFQAGQYDTRFDKDIYEIFGYSEYHRFFVPILMKDTSGGSLVVGVIEAGWSKNRPPDQQIIKEISELGKATGKTIGENRTYVLLEAIAQRAIDIISADSASIHVYQGVETLFQAGAGRADREFLKKHPPRIPNGIGWAAISKQQSIIIDNKDEMISRLPHIYKEGVCAIAAIPLLNMSNEGISGVLYLHFWKPREFKKTVLQIEETFARQIEAVIHNYLLMKKTAEILESAWHVSFFQSFIQSLATVHDTAIILNKIALNALLYLPEADCITLYQYFGSKHKFDSPPVMQGHFQYPNLMHTEINEGEVPWLIMQNGVSQFIDDIAAHKELIETHRNSNKQRFIIREGIQSSAQLVLRSHDREIVGVLFVNYRKKHTFPVEERNALEAFASAGAIAIHISRLVTEERVQRNQLHKLRKIQEEMSAPEALRDLADNILTQLKDLVPYTKSSLQFLDGDQRILLAGKGFDVRRSSLHFVRPISEDPLIRQAIMNHTAIVINNTTTEPLWDTLAETRDVLSWLCLPLIHSKEVIGFLTIDHDQENAFSEVKIPYLMEFAGDAAAQLRKAAKYELAKQRIESLELISMVNSKVSSRVDGYSWAKHTTALIREGLKCDQCTIFCKENEHGNSLLRVLATDGKFSHLIEGRTCDLNSTTCSTSPILKAFRNERKPILKRTSHETKPNSPELPINKRINPREMIIAPMISGDRSTGVIVVEKNEDGYFKESHVIVLDAIARYAGMAIQRDQGFALLHKIGNQTLQATVVDDVLNSIVSIVSVYMEVDYAAICLLGDNQSKKCHMAPSPSIACQFPFMKVLDEITKFMTTQPVEIMNVKCKENPPNNGFKKTGYSSCCVIPLKIKEKGVGFLYLFSSSTRDFSEAERSLLESLATQAALAIQKTRLHQKVEQRLLSTEKRRLALQSLLGVNMFAPILFHNIEKPVTEIPYLLRDTNNAISKIRANTINFDKQLDNAKSECRNHGTIEALCETKKKIVDYLNEIENLVPAINNEVGKLSVLIKGMISSMDKNFAEMAVISHVEVCDLLTRALTQARIQKPSAFEHCSVVADYVNCDEIIETYESLVKEALVNIITNAAEAMHNGGELKITAQKSIYNSEDVIMIIVTDTGIGIPNNDINKIFELSYSRGKQTGSGYGLWFVNFVLEAASIYKEVESQLGSGTTFKLFIPIDQP